MEKLRSTDPHKMVPMAKIDTQDAKMAKLGTTDPHKMVPTAKLDTIDALKMSSTAKLGTQDPEMVPMAKLGTIDALKMVSTAKLVTQDPEVVPMAKLDTQDPKMILMAKLGTQDSKMVSMAKLGTIDAPKMVSNNLEIESLARFAVDEHNKKQNSLLEFGKVISTKEQVVAGTMYYITLEANDGEKKTYEAKVWVKPWMNFKELEAFELVHA